MDVVAGGRGVRGAPGAAMAASGPATLEDLPSILRAAAGVALLLPFVAPSA